jgi:hypothetical protein
MSPARPMRRAPSSSRRSPLNPWTVAAGATVLALAIGLGVAVSSDSSVGSASSVVRTGERNGMGMPVIETPGSVSGTASAAGVEVVGADWALGEVPLNTAVRPAWLLRNTGTETVTIAEPHPEVREGCCPGPFTVEHRTIPPGGEAMLRFELSMHPGMDGWHDIAVHVPVTAGAAEDVLTLSVTGDFRES